MMAFRFEQRGPDRGRGAAAAVLLLSATLLAAALPAGAAATFDPSQSDARAVQIADHVMEALGGQAAWDATHYISFDFLGRRKHVWDKQTGRHRVEGTTKEGKRYVVIENINTHEGEAWLDGQKVSGEELQKMLKQAYATWVNDTYWLLMPYKMKDPGVHLHYDGEETIDGTTYDKVLLSFDHVGLTPGDRYWVYVNRDTGLVDRWAFILESMDPKGPASAWEWKDWKTYGSIKLSPLRTQVGGDRKLELGPIEVSDQVPDEVFNQP